MYTTGARLGDGVYLHPAQVDLDRKIAVRPRSKTGDPRIFYLTDEMVEVLRHLPPKRTHYGKGPLKVFGFGDSSTVHKAWKAACERAGIPYRMRYEPGRHSFATEAVTRQKLHPVTAAALGGWRNPTVLLSVYAHVENLGAVAEEVFGSTGKRLTQANKKLRRVK
jgi:integrase